MTSTVIPVLRYRDAAAAIAFLCDAFGFERHQVHEAPDGTIAHAELRHGTGLVMIGTAHEGDGSPWGQPGQGVAYVVVEDPDAHHDRAVAAGAEIILALTDQDYGSREYGARDPEGNVWSFGTYRPSLEPVAEGQAAG